ncbi:MAG: nucleotide exchange factor GrpE [Clostridiales bacterium]|nr:nucleotide exchange factor GrpE [Clostridiales bacterium]
MESDKNIPIPWPDWHMVRRLGSGGFGSVYEIERELYGDRERAAMKVVKFPESASDLENDYNSGMTEEEVRVKYTYIQKYMMEEYRQMLEYKGHSNIVNCHDFSVIQNPGQPGFTIYIRMELLTSLKEVLRKENFSEARIIQVGTDICRALELCQQKDLIHRDIKPDNILVSEFGNFKLGDFGVARTMEKTMSASKTGTDWYMAPEVAKKMKYGKSVDTYSLGLVLYWLLNHYRLPFVPLKDRITAKDMEMAYRLRIQGKAIPEPAEGSPKLKAIVLKALSFDREKRYHLAREMREALCSIEKPKRNPVQREPAQRESVQREPVQRNAEQGKWNAAEATKGMFGIYFDDGEIHVRMWIEGETRPILKMPAVYTFDDLSDTLAGNCAVNYQKCHKEKKLYSVLRLMKIQDDYESVTARKNGEEICCILMKELKRALEKTPYGKNRDCVITVPVSSLLVQRSIHKAMKEAGFCVRRQISTAVACGISKAYEMKQNRDFAVYIAADGEYQYVKAEYEDGFLEIIENTIDLQREGRMNIPSGPLVYYAGDPTFCRQYRGAEELSVVAADGAALQGAKLRGIYDVNDLLLDVFPWKVGIEIMDENKNCCLPLTWMIQKPVTVPAKSEPVSIRLGSGIQGKRLRMYIGQDEPKQAVRMLEEWKLEKICKKFENEPNQLEAILYLGSDMCDIKIELKQPGRNAPSIPITFLQDEEKKDNPGPLTMALVQQILQELYDTAEKFRSDAESPKKRNMNSAIRQGMQMIARQSIEILDRYKFCDIGWELDTLIEQMLSIADNLEYGLKEAERMQCGNEKSHLLYFYKIIRSNLLKLNVIPIEAQGRRFDPYIHHALAAEWTEGVETDMITEEIQKGYFRGEKLLRAAKVKVAR